VYGEGHLWTGRPQYFLGVILRMAGQDEEADVHLTHSEELLMEKFETSDHPWLRNRQADIDWFTKGTYRTEEIPEIDLEGSPEGIAAMTCTQLMCRIYRYYSASSTPAGESRYLLD